MVIEHIFDTIKLTLNKNRRGAVKVSQIQIAVKAAIHDFYNNELDTYRVGRIIPSSLKKFVKTSTVSLVAGVGALPADFVKEVSFVSDCGSEGDFLSPESFSDRKKSYIIPPSEEFPIAKIQDDSIIVEPDETASVELTHFRSPIDFVYDVNIDGDGRGYTFNPGLPSIDTEFDIEYSGSIIKRALVYLGVGTQNAGAVQLGMTETPPPPRTVPS